MCYKITDDQLAEDVRSGRLIERNRDFDAVARAYPITTKTRLTDVLPNDLVAAA